MALLQGKNKRCFSAGKDGAVHPMPLLLDYCSHCPYNWGDECDVDCVPIESYGFYFKTGSEDNGDVDANL